MPENNYIFQENFKNGVLAEFDRHLIKLRSKYAFDEYFSEVFAKYPECQEKEEIYHYYKDIFNHLLNIKGVDDLKTSFRFEDLANV